MEVAPKQDETKERMPELGSDLQPPGPVEFRAACFLDTVPSSTHTHTHAHTRMELPGVWSLLKRRNNGTISCRVAPEDPEACN